QGFQESYQILLLFKGQAYFRNEGRFAFFVIATPIVIVDYSLQCREASIVHIGSMRGDVAQTWGFEGAPIAFFLGYSEAAFVALTYAGILEFIVGEVGAVVASRATRLRNKDYKAVFFMQGERVFVTCRVAIESRVGDDKRPLVGCNRLRHILQTGSLSKNCFEALPVGWIRVKPANKFSLVGQVHLLGGGNRAGCLLLKAASAPIPKLIGIIS